jgi:hypothetical protein
MGGGHLQRCLTTPGCSAKASTVVKGHCVSVDLNLAVRFELQPNYFERGLLRTDRRDIQHDRRW